MSGTWLGASSSLASPTAGAPKTTLSFPIQWNVTAPNSLELPSTLLKGVSGLCDRRVRSRTQTSPCESPGPGRWRRPTTPAQNHLPDQSQARILHWVPPPTRRTPHRSQQPPLQRGWGQGDEWRASHPGQTPRRCCTGAKAPNASPAFPGPPGPRRPPSLPGFEAGAAAAAAAAAGCGGCGGCGSGFVGPGRSRGWCRGASGGGGGRRRRRRVGEAGGRVVPVHRGGCVGRAGSSGGSSRALCEGGGRGGREGGRGRGRKRRRRRRRELPPHMAPAGGRAEGALASLGLGNPGRSAARPQLSVRDAAASAARTHGGLAPCWWISQDAPPAPSAPRPRPASPRRPALAARGPGRRPLPPPTASRWPAAAGKARGLPGPAGSGDPEKRPLAVLRGPRTSLRRLLGGELSTLAAPRVGRGRACCSPRAREGNWAETRCRGDTKGEACQRFAWSSLFDPSNYFEWPISSVPTSRFLSLRLIPNQKQLSGLFSSSVYSLPAQRLLIHGTLFLLLGEDLYSKKFKLKRIISQCSLNDLSQGLLLTVPTPTLGIFSFWISEFSIPK